MRREFAIQGRGLPVEKYRPPFDSLLRAGLAVNTQSRLLTVEQFHSTLSMALAVGRTALSLVCVLILLQMGVKNVSVARLTFCSITALSYP